MAYPDRKFEEEEAVLLTRLITECILDLARGNKIRSFKAPPTEMVQSFLTVPMNGLWNG
jgi:hypothetical protein